MSPTSNSQDEATAYGDRLEIGPTAAFAARAKPYTKEEFESVRELLKVIPDPQ